MLPTIGIQDTAKPGDSSSVRSPVVVGKPSTTFGKPSTALGKTSILLEKPPTAVVTRSPTGPTSTASRVVVINTSSAVSTKVQPTQTASSSPAMKSVISQATSERIGLLATTTTSSSSSRPTNSTTVVIIRSSASLSLSSNTNTKCTPSAATVVKKSSGSVVMSVKKLLPVKCTVVKDVPSSTSMQRKLAPVIKLAPFTHNNHEGSNVPVFHENTSLVLQDSWKQPVTNIAYQTAHAKSVGVWTQKVCGMDCSGRLGVPPTLYCDMCMALFHPECVGFSYLGRHVGFLCRPCRQLTVELQTSKYVLNTQLPAVSSETHTLTGSHQGATFTSSQTTHSLPTQAVTTSEESISRRCLTGAGVLSTLVTSSPLTSGSAVTTKIPLSIDACLSSTQASVSTSCVSVIPASVVSTSQTLSNLVEQGTLTSASSGGIIVRCMPQISGEDSDVLPNTSIQQMKEADPTVNRADVIGAIASRDDAGELSELAPNTASAANDCETVTATDEGTVQQTSLEKEQAVDSATAAADDSGIQLMSSKPLQQAKADKVTAASDVAVTCSGSSEVTVSSKLPTTLDSSFLKANSDEQTAQESVMTSSLNKDDEHDESDTGHAMSGDVSQEKTAAKTNGTESCNSDSDICSGSQKETGLVQSDSVSHVKDDVNDGEHVEDTTKTSSLEEQQLRQLMTLPADLLSLLNPSLPISLTLKHDRHHQITVPAANIYQSKSGLRLLLPANSLPVEYIDSKQLVCTLGHSDDMSKLQQISVSLAVQCQ